ncbi:MAG: McrC family protein [Flavonifractor plautii]|nr:McrC family protein [Flavonifractor plautii]MDU6290540.1 McrC family protein [Flavonifractor plautii]MDU6342718.1 McrC family protein [Flavonifractor plautii]
MRKTYQITEYGSFVRDREVPGYISLPQDTFDTLESFVLSNSTEDTDALKLMGVSARKGVGKIITAKNYVGVITMNDGTTIEILPKIFSHAAFTDEEEKEKKVKKLLIDMLKTLRNTPFKSLQATNVNIDKLSIFEIFIRMFVDEVFYIVKRGLKCDYETIQSNENVFKGKMVFAVQIKHNYAHKERSFVGYDEFNTNRAENKILKSTLSYLYKCTTSSRNKSDIKTLLNAFNSVDESNEYKSDFAKIVPDRKTADYQTALMWSKVFLMGKSFTSFSGSEVAFALLFPMETLFESYIAAQLKKMLGHSEYSLSAQDKTYHLFDEPRKFLMKPDIVIKNKALAQVFVMDTKWKVLSADKANYAISQADMYQMYAYQKKYTSENVTLLYPLTEKVDPNQNIEFLSNDGTVIRIRFVDLFDLSNSLNAIVGEIKGNE